MASRKKTPVVTIPGNQVSVLPPGGQAQVPAAPALTMPLAMLPGHMIPANGLVVDNNAAVSYVTSIRRRQLREAKGKCETARKSIREKVVEVQKILNAAMEAQVVVESKDWIKSLTTTFEKTKTPLKASASLNSGDPMGEDKRFQYTRRLDGKSRNSYNPGTVWEEYVSVKADNDVLKAMGALNKYAKTSQEVAEVEVKIQQELTELQYSAMETQAALFAQSLTADPSGQGAAMLATLDAKIASMGKIPDLPNIEI